MMALDYQTLINWHFDDVRHSYTERDTILYALGLGLGRDPMNRAELPFVYENALRALPMMNVILGSPGMWVKDPATGITWVKLVHSAQSAHFYKLLPSAGEVISQARVKSLYDRGERKGAILTLERRIIDASSGELYATVLQTLMLRGDGGFGGELPPEEAIAAIPERAPDRRVQLRTSSDQAILYRLSGDWNPLHIDPDVAASAGFNQPILHGLCSYAIAGWAIIREFIDQPEQHLERLASLSARFTKPVLPGQTLEFEFWKEGDVILFRALIEGELVLNQGVAELRPSN